MELREFIEARLNEDEQWARAASRPYRYADEGATAPESGVHWTWAVGEDWTPVTVDPALDDTVGGPDHYGCSVTLRSVEEWRSGQWMMASRVATEMVEVDASAAGHIARHDPARVLREVAYKRRLLTRHAPVIDGTQSSWAWFEGSESASEEALREMATVWSDHPDYRQEWAL